jgi:hypothetical protein
MSTLRVSGPLDVGRGQMGMYLRMIAVSGLLCAVVFAASFALGRAERPGAASAEASVVSLPATAAGPAIPVALSSAPAIAIEAPVVARSTVHVRPQADVARNLAPATLPTSAAAAPSSPSPPATVAPATPTAPVTASPHEQPSGNGSSRGSGGTKPEASGGTSFDSSG